MLVRCSSLHEIMTKPCAKSEVLSETAKSCIARQVRLDQFGFDSFTGNRYTEKGNELEDLAIIKSGEYYNRFYMKNEERLSNEFITGECDILDRKNSLIIDTKNSWNIGTHPFFQGEAVKKTKEAGYDWQGQGYMWLYDVEFYEVHYWLFPCPPEMLGKYDDYHQLVTLVEMIPESQRLQIVRFERDNEKIEQIKSIVPHAQEYYRSLLSEIEVA